MTSAYLGFDIILHFCSIRVPEKKEQELFVSYITNLLTCNFTQLPVEVFAHSEFIAQSSAFPFMADCTEQAEATKCKQHIMYLCGSAQTYHRDPAVSWANQCPQVIEHFIQSNPTNLSDVFLKDMQTKFGMNKTRAEIFLAHHQCMKAVGDQVDPCIRTAIQVCLERQVHALEILRSNLNAVEEVVERLPEIFVVFYVRDPRAVAASTIRVKLNSAEPSILKEARILCRKMELDLVDYKRLSAKYPGVFLLVKYEDLVLNPHAFGDKVFQHIGMGNCSQEWVEVFTNSSRRYVRSKNAKFGTFVHNRTLHLHDWRKVLRGHDLIEVNTYCKTVLDEMGYEM
jgi:hypothetical protein